MHAVGEPGDVRVTPPLTATRWVGHSCAPSRARTGRTTDKATSSPSMLGPRHGSRILLLKGTPRIRGVGRTTPKPESPLHPRRSGTAGSKARTRPPRTNLRVERLRRVMTSESVSPRGGHPQRDRGKQDHHQQAEMNQQGPSPFLPRAPHCHVPSVPVPPAQHTKRIQVRARNGVESTVMVCEAVTT